MSLSKYGAVIATFFSVMLAASPATAANDLPPPWRGQPGTTYQDWSFATDANPAAPEAVTNPFGSPLATITVGNMGSGWWLQLEGLGNQNGYWDIGGSGGQIVVNVPNQSLPLGHKDVWVQMVYYRDISESPTLSVEGGTRLTSQTVVVESISTGGQWLRNQSLWRLTPGPASESVTIVASPNWGSIVESITVDTLLNPAPDYCHVPVQDVDGNGTVDSADLLVFSQCANGPAIPFSTANPQCACFDQDGDGDLDATDFAAVQRTLTVE